MSYFSISLCFYSTDEATERLRIVLGGYGFNLCSFFTINMMGKQMYSLARFMNECFHKLILEGKILRTFHWVTRLYRVRHHRVYNRYETPAHEDVQKLCN